MHILHEELAHLFDWVSLILAQKRHNGRVSSLHETPRVHELPAALLVVRFRLRERCCHALLHPTEVQVHALNQVVSERPGPG